MVDLLKYYTIINLIFVIIFLKTKIKIINLHLSTLFVFLVGIYLTYVLNKLVISLDSINFKKTYRDKELKLGDFLFHFLPFFTIWTFYDYNYSINETYSTLLIISIYFVLFNPFRLYKVEEYQKDLRYIIIFCILIFFLIEIYK